MQVCRTGPDHRVRDGSQRGTSIVSFWHTILTLPHHHPMQHASPSLLPCIALSLFSFSRKSPTHSHRNTLFPIRVHCIFIPAHLWNPHRRRFDHCASSPQQIHMSFQSATESHTTDAIKLGYRGIDTANQPKHYNEAAVRSYPACLILISAARNSSLRP